uniref:Serpentine Receptor, class T n=1 Tax=Meloidogyne incognita TaxID=6306 RepID=A0A914LDB3_MELIC
MEDIFWNRKEFDIIYNCTGINVDDIPFEKRSYPIPAIICIVLGCIYYPLYFPCVYSFWKNRAKNPCYILLIQLSIFDILFLWNPSFGYGIFSLYGVVYCSAPFFTYFVGCTALYLWAAECAADMILGINRCLEMAFPKIGKILFHNNRVYIWIAFCNLYGLYWLLFRHNYIFNGMAYSSPFDPLIGYRPFRIELFTDDVNDFTIHNTILAIGSPILYLIFSICIFFKGRELIKSISKEEKLVFIQVFIISMLNTSDGIAYAYIMNHPDHGMLPAMIAHFSWLHIHGKYIFLLIFRAQTHF